MKRLFFEDLLRRYIKNVALGASEWMGLAWIVTHFL
jgi:hypothetical protein